MNIKYKKCYTEDIWTPDHFKMDMTNWFHNEIPQSKKVYCGSLQGRDRRDSREKLSSTKWHNQNKERSDNSIGTTISPNESMNCEIIPSCICSKSLEFSSLTNLQPIIIRNNDSCTCYLNIKSSEGESLDSTSESIGENRITGKLYYSCKECLENKSHSSVIQRKKILEEERLSEFDEYCQYKDWEKMYKILMRVNCREEELTDKSMDRSITNCNKDIPKPHRNNEMHGDFNDNIFVNMNRPKITNEHCMFYKGCICHNNNTIV